LGEAGFWVFQQITLACLFLSLYQIAKSQAGARPAAILCIIVAHGTNLFWFYSYDFSYDVLGAAFVLGGVALLRKKPWLGGVLLGLSLHIRITHLIMFPFIFYALSLDRPQRLRFWLIGGLAALLAWSPILIANHYYFHNALAGPYAGVVMIVNGSMLPDLKTHGFAWNYLWQEWFPRLVSSRTSLLSVYPAMFLAIPAWVLCWKHPARSFAWLLATAGLLHLLIHLSFYGWLQAGGARYVLPSALLMLIPVAFITFKKNSSA
jgi:hypothetical protein